MDQRKMAPRGMAVAPHHLATQSALTVLRDGGTAIEATVAAAATIAVVYPHMNSIGGDGFWLIIPPHEDPFVIEGCGAAGSLANAEFFKGHDKIPNTGPKSAITVSGTVGGWQEALNYVSECGYRRIATSKLLADAVSYAEHGFPVSSSHAYNLKEFVDKNTIFSQEFKKVYLPDGKVPEVGEKFSQKILAQTLKLLSNQGLNSFYKGDVSKLIADDMAALGMPIIRSDLENYSSVRRTPLKLVHTYGELLNSPPPTQGLCSLAILGILDKLGYDGKDEGQFIHTTVEATKQVFNLRDKYITDPSYMTVDPKILLSNEAIYQMALNINPDKASSIGSSKGPGDTIWIGVMDDKGFSVSFIQSIFQNFGSGVVLPRTGILWHNRGFSFRLDADHLLSLKPGKKPLHTLNPAAARLNDGRIVVYGTRGGDGQPQTQAAIFHRYVVQGLPLQKSVSSPRWLYGRTVGDHDNLLKLEDRFSEETVKYLKDRGHNIVILPSFSEIVGHAGALVRHEDGMLEGAYDPRGNGSADGF